MAQNSNLNQHKSPFVICMSLDYEQRELFKRNFNYVSRSSSVKTHNCFFGNAILTVRFLLNWVCERPASNITANRKRFEEMFQADSRQFRPEAAKDIWDHNMNVCHCLRRKMKMLPYPVLTGQQLSDAEKLGRYDFSIFASRKLRKFMMCWRNFFSPMSAVSCFGLLLTSIIVDASICNSWIRFMNDHRELNCS